MIDEERGSVVEAAPRQPSTVARPAVAIVVLAALLGAAVWVGSLGGDSAPTVEPPAAVTNIASEPINTLLLQWADAIAKSSGGRAAHVQAVLVPQDATAPTLGGNFAAALDKLWLLQVVGDRQFVCRDCPRPPGAATPRGRVLQLTIVNGVSGSQLVVQDDVVDLGRLGKVVILR